MGFWVECYCLAQCSNLGIGKRAQGVCFFDNLVYALGLLRVYVGIEALPASEERFLLFGFHGLFPVEAAEPFDDAHKALRERAALFKSLDTPLASIAIAVLFANDRRPFEDFGEKAVAAALAQATNIAGTREEAEAPCLFERQLKAFPHRSIAPAMRFFSLEDGLVREGCCVHSGALDALLVNGCFLGQFV